MERFLTADGRTLSYRREGSGPVLVCHPGGPGFSSRYFDDLAGLGESFTLVLLNPRGTEGSDRPADPGAYRTEDYVSDLDELRAHLSLERMLLLGHSHGGVVAQAYAAAHPDRVERLVLASTLARFAAEQQEAMEAGMRAKAGEPWYEDALAALEDEQEGRFDTDEELAELALREFPFYFGELRRCRARLPRPAARRGARRGRAAPVQQRGVHHVRPSSRAAEDHGADAGDHRRGRLHHRAGLRGRLRGRPRLRTVILPDCGHFIFVEARDGFRADVTLLSD